MKEKLRLRYCKSKNQINMTKFIFISVLLLFVVWIFDVRIPSRKVAIPEGLTLINMISAESAYSSIEAYFADVYEVLVDAIPFRHDKRHLQMLRSKFYRKQELGDEEATKTAAESEEE